MTRPEKSYFSLSVSEKLTFVQELTKQTLLLFSRNKVL